VAHRGDRHGGGEALVRRALGATRLSLVASRQGESITMSVTGRSSDIVGIDVGGIIKTAVLHDLRINCTVNVTPNGATPLTSSGKVRRADD